MGPTNSQRALSTARPLSAPFWRMTGATHVQGTTERCESPIWFLLQPYKIKNLFPSCYIWEKVTNDAPTSWFVTFFLFLSLSLRKFWNKRWRQSTIRFFPSSSILTQDLYRNQMSQLSVDLHATTITTTTIINRRKKFCRSTFAAPPTYSFIQIGQLKANLFSTMSHKQKRPQNIYLKIFSMTTTTPSSPPLQIITLSSCCHTETTTTMAEEARHVIDLFIYF